MKKILFFIAISLYGHNFCSDLDTMIDNLIDNSVINAAKENNLNEVQFFLNSDVEVNAIDEFNWTALMHAAYNGNISIVQSLLNAQADVNAKDNLDRTALMWAIEKGHVKIIELLLDKGANVNARNKDGNTVLMQSILNKHIKIVELLLNSVNIDIDLKDRYGKTALQIAHDLEHKEMVDLLKFYQNEYKPYLNGLRPEYDKLISERISNSNLIPDVSTVVAQYYKIPFSYFLNKIRKNQVILNMPESCSRLINAAQEGDQYVVQYLLAAGVNVNAIDRDNYTALTYAITHNHIKIVELLINAGADVNTISNGWTPIMHAVKSKNTKIVELLLDSGADVNARNKYGHTALIWATIEGYTEIVKSLLNSFDIKVNLLTNKDKTALQIAREYHGRQEIIDLINKRSNSKYWAEYLNYFDTQNHPYDRENITGVASAIDLPFDLGKMIGNYSHKLNFFEYLERRSRSL